MEFGKLLAAGRTRVAAGDFLQAGQFFEMALALQPGSGLALAGLGHCLGRMGRRSEAVECLQRAGRALARTNRREGGDNLLLDVAHELQLINAFAESLGVVERVLRARPTLARGHHLKALALERLNDPAGARQSAVRAHALATGESNATILLATLEARCGELDKARSRLEALAADRTDPNRQRALFELGRVLDRQGACAAAFAHLVEAGRLGLAAPPVCRFDLQSIYRELAEEQTKCTTTWLQDFSCHSDDGHADPIFLVGFYRSGTTLLEQILAAHSRIQSIDETGLIPELLKELHRRLPDGRLHWTERIATLGRGITAELRRHYWQRAELHMGKSIGNALLLDKTALNSINIGLIRTIFPRAHIIFARRDPRDVLVSCFMQPFAPTLLTAHFLDWREGARLYDSVMNHWEAMTSLPGTAVTEIRYEDVIADVRGSVTPFLHSLGLDWQEAMGRFHEFARKKAISTPSFSDVARPVYRSAEGKWRRYAEQFEAIAPFVQPHVERHGYGNGSQP